MRWWRMSRGQLAEELVDLPFEMRQAVRRIVKDGEAKGIYAMLEREQEFPTKTAAVLSGIAAWAPARRYFDDVYDNYCMKLAVESQAFMRRRPKDVREVVVGSGVHAAIYCAVRAQAGVRPLVVEAGSRAGGVFAISKEPSYWLNSRNRPGDLSVPGEPGALNVLPGSCVQPADVSGGEYQTNTDLAWAARMTLMLYADMVLTNTKITSIDKSAPGEGGYLREGGYILGTDNGSIRARRVIVASGLGQPAKFPGENNASRCISFLDFMKGMDNTFPLQGMKRVAVIGPKDSGRCAIEALCGQAPQSGMSVAGLDWPDRIDWYGQEIANQKEWCDLNRGRYARIGKLLQRRVFPIPSRAKSIQQGYEKVYVNATPYDWAINCTGFVRRGTPGDEMSPLLYSANGRNVGFQLSTGGRKEEVYMVGPMVDLPYDNSDRQVPGLPENATSLWRYADRTAALAASLA